MSFFYFLCFFFLIVSRSKASGFLYCVPEFIAKYLQSERESLKIKTEIKNIGNKSQTKIYSVSYDYCTF